MSAGPTNFPLSSHFVKTWCSGNTGTPTAGVLATQKDSGLYLKCHEKISLISLNRSTLMSWDCLYRQCILDASFTFCYYLNIFLIYCIQSLTLLEETTWNDNSKHWSFYSPFIFNRLTCSYIYSSLLCMSKPLHVFLLAA